MQTEICDKKVELGPLRAHSPSLLNKSQLDLQHHMHTRPFHGSFTSAKRTCRYSGPKRRMKGTARATGTPISTIEACKLSKHSGRYTTPDSHPILTYFQHHMLNRRPSLYRSTSSARYLAQLLTPAFPSMVTTRNKSYNHDTAPQEPGEFVSTKESFEDRRTRWVRLLRLQHYEPVISDVLDEELPKYKNSTIINATNRITHKRDCAQILASAPSVFTSAVEGDLVRRMLSEPGLREEYAAITEHAYRQPSIYVHLLADRDGIPPTPNQYLTIRDKVIEYVALGEASEDAWKIDKITHPFVTKSESAKGHRKYLHTFNRSERRVETLRRFCEGAQKRWLETPAPLHDTPFRYPPGECGYSINSHVRLAQHRAHRSSNYVMNLVEDICTYLHETDIFKQHFMMHQFIIYLILRQDQARIAEIFCSGLLQVWVQNGGGFNAYPAGHNVPGAKRGSDVDWASHGRNTKFHSDMMENIRRQQLRADEWRQALELANEHTVDEHVRDDSADEEAECIAHLSQLSM